jgi:plastocyanin
MKRIGSLLALVLVMGLAAVSCGNGSDETTPAGGGGGGAAASESPSEGGESGTTTIEGQTVNDHGSADVSGKADTSLELDDFYFEPTVLEGEAGQQISIELENEGEADHNFSITDQNIDQDVAPGDKTEIQVTFPDSGSVLFFCRFHESSGMAGALEVA